MNVEPESRHRACWYGRRTPIIPAALAAEDLGIEENEFDKPAYLRRGLHAHDPSNQR